MSITLALPSKGRLKDQALKHMADAGLPAEIRGRADARKGVLAKAPKPVQERRVDLPVVGVTTVEGAAAAGLAGIAVEAEGALIVDREATLRAAEAHGLFLVALRPDGA